MLGVIIPGAGLDGFMLVAARSSRERRGRILIGHVCGWGAAAGCKLEPAHKHS